MNLSQAAELLRRRWYVLVVGLLVGAMGGFLTAPDDTNVSESWRSQSVLIGNPASSEDPLVVNTAVLVTSGEVPKRVAERLGLSIEEARSGVTATPLKDNQTLTITAVDDDQNLAQSRAALFAEELLAELGGGELVEYNNRLENARQQVEDQDDRVFFLEQARQVLVDNRNPTEESLAALQEARRQLIDLKTNLQGLEAQGPPQPKLVLLETKPAVLSSSLASGFKLPADPLPRAGVMALFGLLLGVAGAVGLDRVDTRIRSRQHAEEAFDTEVIGEIPALTRRDSRDPRLMLGETGGVPFIEAYRAVRTVIAMNFSAREAAVRNGSGPPAHRVIVVTSATASEAKTTTVAHLAVLLAEIGKTVLVVSGDFRRPRIHQFFGVPQAPGFVDALERGTPIIDTVIDTEIENIRLLPSGTSTHHPSTAILAAAKLITAARDVFDYVLVDTPPVLVANDANELMQVADAVLLTAKVGETRHDAAMKAAQALAKVDAPLLGVVLCGSTDSDLSYYYYRSPYAIDDRDGEPRSSWLPWRRKRSEAAEQVASDGDHGKADADPDSEPSTSEPEVLQAQES